MTPLKPNKEDPFRPLFDFLLTKFNIFSYSSRPSENMLLFSSYLFLCVNLDYMLFVCMCTVCIIRCSFFSGIKPIKKIMDRLSMILRMFLLYFFLLLLFRCEKANGKEENIIFIFKSFALCVKRNRKMNKKKVELENNKILEGRNG